MTHLTWLQMPRMNLKMGLFSLYLRKCWNFIVLFYFILFYFILFYFILFYFILFCFALFCFVLLCFAFSLSKCQQV